MRKRLFVIPLIISTFALTGCKAISTFYHAYIAPEHLSTLTKVDLAYTYEDYTAKNFYDVSCAPSTGDVHLLVVPIWFADSSNYIPISEKERVKSDIYKAYFGSQEDTGWHSVSSYYKEESKNRLNLTGEVTDWYSCGRSSSYFYSSSDTTTDLVREVVSYYKNRHSASEIAKFDSDNNGYLDGVMLIYGSPDYSTMKNDEADNMWAYCFWLQDGNANPANPNPNAFFWASYDFMYGYTNHYGDYFGGDTYHCKLDTHTYIHEMGHIFGLEDYYDYSGKTLPAGGFSMQDYNVGGHDPYSIMALGWANPYVPKESCQVQLNKFQDTHDLIILSPDFTGSPFDEYLILELYSPTGLNKFDTDNSYLNMYPQGPTVNGIRLWHVDARLVELDESATELRNDNYSITNKIKNGKIYHHLMSNTRYTNETEGYASILGRSYSDYNLLQLVRNNKTTSYLSAKELDKGSLFRMGDSFSMSNFKLQFKQWGKLNNNKTLGWSFRIDKLNEERAIITLTKK